MTDQHSVSSLPGVTVLSRDLFFSMRIRGALKQLGYRPEVVQTEAELTEGLAAAPALAIVDFNTPIDWPVIAAAVDRYPDVPVIAFGAHTDTEGFGAARNAGAARVFANRSLSQQLPELVARYARQDRPENA